MNMGSGQCTESWPENMLAEVRGIPLRQRYDVAGTSPTHDTKKRSTGATIHPEKARPSRLAGKRPVSPSGTSIERTINLGSHRHHSGRQLFVRYHFNHVIKHFLMPPPVWNFAVQKFEELGAVVVVDQMSHLVSQDIIHTLAWCFHKMWVQNNLTIGRAGPPLVLHL
jgi:hypothetical protein